METITFKLVRCAGLSILCLLFWGALGFAAGPPSLLQGSHGDQSLMPKSCRACHRGMNMLVDGEEETCITCHGDAQLRKEMTESNFLKGSAAQSLGDIAAELKKPYSHPVLSIKGVHRTREVLPEELVAAARHSECVDCHEPHVVEKDRPFRGIPGKRVGNFIADIEKEHELCYKCHSSSANLPLRSSNKAEEFRTTNPSFHPVEGEGKNAYVISLKEPYAARQEKPGQISVISCRDCHGNDDPNGPKGPHGSQHRGLLVANYEMEDERPESEYAYALCYKCHSRASILGNESFPWHALHIAGNPAANRPGTTCFTCHDAHGSTVYANLIRFNEEIVRPAADGKLEFKSQGVATRHGSCTLTCHGVEHNPKAY